MKIALVYDRVNKFGGAERVLLALHQLWPQAPLFTAVYSPRHSRWADPISVRPSFLNHFPFARTHHELYPWLTPLAFESFNLSRFDVVISVTSAEAKAVITPPQTLHLCYCLTPTRYLWSHYQHYFKDPILGFGLKLWHRRLQADDLIYSRRPDQYLAISQTVSERIKQYYHQDARVIFPPVETEKFSFSPAKEYYLVVSRLVSYKKIALAIKACNQLQEKLVIVGAGREKKALQKLSGPTIKFVGLVSEEKLAAYYQRCRALIMPQEEDFGISSLECQASGKPVIAYRQGGARETIVNNQTGIFFSRQTVDSLINAMKQSKARDWDKNIIQSQAKKFDQAVFKTQFKQLVEEQWSEHQRRQPKS